MNNLDIKLEEILFAHRANDRGNHDLNLFEDIKELEEQDQHYAEKLKSLFKELCLEVIGEDDDIKTALDRSDFQEISNKNVLRFQQRKHLMELLGGE